jgi:hypothetical protein
MLSRKLTVIALHPCIIADHVSICIVYKKARYMEQEATSRGLQDCLIACYSTLLGHLGHIACSSHHKLGMQLSNAIIESNAIMSE